MLNFSVKKKIIKSIIVTNNNKVERGNKREIGTSKTNGLLGLAALSIVTASKKNLKKFVPKLGAIEKKENSNVAEVNCKYTKIEPKKKTFPFSTGIFTKLVF